MNLPLITAIIPTFKRPFLLKRAIESILAQTYSNFEVRVYDNASGDETREIVHELMKSDSRIKYYCHEENIGPWANFQFGLKHVQTPFFAFLSDDDIVFPWFYEEALGSLEKNPESAFFAGDVIFAEESKVIGHSLQNWQKEGFYTKEEGFASMIENMPPIWTAILFRTSLVKNIGDLDLEVGTFFDNDYLFRISSYCPFTVLKRPCGVFFQYPTSLSHTIKLETVWPGWSKMIDNLASSRTLPLELKTKAEVALKKGLEKWLKSLFISFIKDENKKELIQLLKIAKPPLISKKIFYVFLFLSKLKKIEICIIFCWASLRKLKKHINFLKSKQEFKKLQSYLTLVS